MKVVVTGAAGFLGARLADYLLSEESGLDVTQLVLTDAVAPERRSDKRVTSLALDLTAAGAARRLLEGGVDAVLHLAAVVSGSAEQDFDFGLAVNLDATRELLEATRHLAPGARFVFASTVGVFGGELPPTVDERTATRPQTSYGTAKAICELLVAEYSRRGFIDGCSLRLPTVTVRGGAPNTAVTSFASGLVREPLAGVEAIVPVPAAQELWISSPRTVVRNIAKAAALPAGALCQARFINLPGLRVSVGEMVAALRAIAGPEVAARVTFSPNDSIARMVATFPIQFDNAFSFSLGFEGDNSFADIVKMYMKDDLKMNIKD